MHTQPRSFAFLTSLTALITLALVLLFSTPAYAKNFVLFDSNGTVHPQYDAFMKDLSTGRFSKIKIGDTIQFSDGRKFKINKILGSGGNTVVIDVGDAALRIPLYEAKQKTIVSFIEGYEELAKSNTQTVKILESGQELAHNQWVLVEKLEIKYELPEFLKKYNAASAKARAAMEPAVKQLEYFFGSTWKWSDIGDISAEQIGFDGKKWRLLDWDTKHKPANLISGVTVVDEVGLRGALRDRMIDTVMKRRDMIRSCSRTLTAPSNALKLKNKTE